MPQHRSKRGGKAQGPPKAVHNRTGTGGSAPASTAAEGANSSQASWQRSQGGFSSKAKKEYLQWKRQHKAAAAADDEGSGSERGVQEASTDSSTQPHGSNVAPAAAARAGRGRDGTSAHSQDAASATAGSTLADRSSRSHAAAADRQGTGQKWTAGGSTDDPTQPLAYRPLVAVPAAPFDAVSAAAAAASANAAAAAAGPGADAVQAAAGDGSEGSQGVVYMPRLDPAEVGFTAEGFTLDMPTRPAWQGVVHSAEELHALEEQQFEAWQAALLQQAAHSTPDKSAADLASQDGEAGTGSASHGISSLAAAAGSAGSGSSHGSHHHQQQQGQGQGHQQQQQGSSRAGGVGRLSFYEGRLEFWRQLWRTLEMSDVVLMIVDARNPLLHFSHALYRHITQHHKLPLLLLLNKCDLVPAAAAAAWQQWLQQQLPGVRVVPVSAAAGQADAAARQVLDAVLQLRVERGGQQVVVQDFVGMSVDELVEASVTRNTHAKRHIMQQQQDSNTAAAAAAVGETEEAAGDGSDAGDGHAGSGAHGSHSSDGDGDGADDGGADESSSDEGWSLKPSRTARKARRTGRKGKTQQQQQQAQQQQQQAQQQQSQHVPGKGSKGSNAAGTARGSGRRAVRCSSVAAVASSDNGDSGSESVEVASSTDADGSDGFEGVETAGRGDEFNAVADMLEGLTLERRLSSTTNSSTAAGLARASAAAAAAATAAAAPLLTEAGAAAAEEAAAAGGGASSWHEHDSRPVVIGLLGEPNVGKSSTLNALLGTHRVAVSCHPGRTKHYQTHFMSSRLVLCDCPGIVFPRLDVSLPMQVLFGSFPIASCRQPYAVVRYLAQATWPRIHTKLGLKQDQDEQQQQQEGLGDAAVYYLPAVAAAAGEQASQLMQQGHGQGLQQQQGCGTLHANSHSAPSTDSSNSAPSSEHRSRRGDDGGCDVGDVCSSWSPWSLCEALAEKRRWVLPRSGRLDTYRAANWLLRAALAGQQGLGLAFMPPAADEGAAD